MLDVSCTKGYWWSHNYIDNLSRTFGLSSSITTINCLDDLGQYAFRKLDGGYAKMVNVTLQREFSRCDWPCVPRRRPLAVVDSTHDLPNSTNQISMKMINKLLEWKMFFN